MTALVSQGESLPALVDRASSALANARTSAEVLEARDVAAAVYDLAKRTARLMQAKQAHDELVAAAYRAQGDALLIESQAKIRLADEYDAAQESGAAAVRGRPAKEALEKRSDDPTFFKPGDGRLAAEAVAEGFGIVPAKLSEMHLTKDQVREARVFRDAEREDPGVVRRVINERIAAGEEPTKAAVREAVHGVRPKPAPAVTGDSAVYHAIYETRQRIEPLGDARGAIRRFPSALRHTFTANDLDALANWFRDAADEWRKLGAFNVAAE